jgi:uncharacterized coiled-coil DUF342 family protein
MGFSFKTAFDHLDGLTLTYGDLMNEIIEVRRKYLGDLAPEVNTHDMLYQMMQMGWVSFPDDGTGGDTSTCIFKICEDVREVRKRIDSYKEQFVREQALRWLDEMESDGQCILVKVDLKEYEQAVRELAAKES